MLQLAALTTSISKEINLTLDSAETIVITGKSGSGKSLLLRAIADLDLHEGRLLLDGTDSDSVSGDQWRKKVRYFPAESGWWYDLVGEHMNGVTTAEYQKLGLNDSILRQQVSSCSSGERQRLALIRGLIDRPKVLLLDEPTSSLDEQSRLLVEEYLKDYLNREQASAIWVTHHQDQISNIGSKVYELVDGQLMESDNG